MNCFIKTFQFVEILRDSSTNNSHYSRPLFSEISTTNFIIFFVGNQINWKTFLMKHFVLIKMNLVQPQFITERES